MMAVTVPHFSPLVNRQKCTNTCHVQIEGDFFKCFRKDTDHSLQNLGSCLSTNLIGSQEFLKTKDLSNIGNGSVTLRHLCRMDFIIYRSKVKAEMFWYFLVVPNNYSVLKAAYSYLIKEN